MGESFLLVEGPTQVVVNLRNTRQVYFSRDTWSRLRVYRDERHSRL